MKNWYKISQSEVILSEEPKGLTKEERAGSFVWVYFAGIKFKVLSEIINKLHKETIIDLIAEPYVYIDNSEIINSKIFFDHYFNIKDYAIPVEKRNQLLKEIREHLNDISEHMGPTEKIIVDFEGIRFYVNIEENKWYFTNASIINPEIWALDEDMPVEWRNAVEFMARRKLFNYVSGMTKEFLNPVK